MIPVNEENFCKGGLIELTTTSKKSNNLGSAIKKKLNNEPCMLRFCSECLEKHYKESWIAIKKNPELWICPVCCGTCLCT